MASSDVSAIPLASFCCQARGIMFYDTTLSMVVPGTLLRVVLEPSNPYDVNCVALWLTSHGLQLGHLAREAAACLAPLLRIGCIWVSITVLSFTFVRVSLDQYIENIL